MSKSEMALIAAMVLLIGVLGRGIHSAWHPSFEGVEIRRENHRHLFITECAMRRPASECVVDARIIYP